MMATSFHAYRYSMQWWMVALRTTPSGSGEWKALRVLPGLAPTNSPLSVT